MPILCSPWTTLLWCNSILCNWSLHNLLLGTVKHMLSVWTSNGIIDKPNFIHIQEKIDSFLTPSDIGRIPLKISSGFTAEQWWNWTLIYSLCSLKEILPHRHYDCWLQFVKATSLLCRRQITLQQLDEGDTLLMKFCESFETLYGKNHYNINLHLHGHIKECIWTLVLFTHSGCSVLKDWMAF